MNRKQTHALFALGKDAWNAWAEHMATERQALEAEGTWKVTQDGRPDNDETRAWQAAAAADFSTGEHPHQFRSNMQFDGFKFPGSAHFSAATFGGAATFNSARFEDEALFANTQFVERPDFTAARFLGVSYFGGAKFKAGAIFQHAIFEKNASFNSAEHDGWSAFDRAAFQSHAAFTRSTFALGATFEATQMNSALFYYSKFGGIARFDGARIEGSAIFGLPDVSSG
jgi:hypothetical protein